jgi:hypothetical protein
MTALISQLLNPRLWLSLLVCAAIAYALHWTYQSGGAAADARLANYMASSQAAGLKESEAQRAKESAYQSAVTTLGASLAKQKSRIDAADQRTTDSLRDFQAAASAATCNSAPGTDAAATAGADAAARAGFVLGRCAATLAAMAQSADACDARLEGLQGYVRDMLRISNGQP